MSDVVIISHIGEDSSLQLNGIERGKGNLSIKYEFKLFAKYGADEENKNKNGL